MFCPQCGTELEEFTDAYKAKYTKGCPKCAKVWILLPWKKEWVEWHVYRKMAGIFND